jgi:hypothetical protein
MVSSLFRRQLVTKSEISGKPCLLTHRSLQHSILHRLDNEEGKLQDIFIITFTLLRKVFPRQSSIQFPQNDLWKVWEQYSPHVMSLRKVYAESEERLSLSIEFAEILGDVANYFWERNIFNDGLLACESAEKICNTLEGRFPHQQANIFTLGASILLHDGISERKQSLRRFHRAKERKYKRSRVSAIFVKWALCLPVSRDSNLSLLRSWFRKALERPEEWTREAEVRAQYHLGKLLSSKQKPSDARDFLMKAQSTKDEL